MRDTINTNKADRVFSFALLLTDISHHFNIDLSCEQQVITTASDVISGQSIYRSGFKYIEIEKRWITRSGLTQWEDFSHNS